jgi:hypothetical protein
LVKVDRLQARRIAIGYGRECLAPIIGSEIGGGEMAAQQESTTEHGGTTAKGWKAKWREKAEWQSIISLSP